MPVKMILVVDDEECIRGIFESAAEAEFSRKFFGETNRVKILTAPSVEGALEILKNHLVNLLLTDMELGPHLGWEIIAEAQKLSRPPILAIMSGKHEFESVAEKQGIVFFQKPFTVSSVLGWMKEQLFPEILEISLKEE